VKPGVQLSGQQLIYRLNILIEALIGKNTSMIVIPRRKWKLNLSLSLSSRRNLRRALKLSILLENWRLRGVKNRVPCRCIMILSLIRKILLKTLS